MLVTPITNAQSFPDDWADRNAKWLVYLDTLIPPRRLRQRNLTSLILCGHGVSLRIESDCLLIRDGFTHYPQEQAIRRFFPGDLDLPTRILLLDGSGTLSFDVLSWLAEQGVALARVKWTGEVATVGSGSGYAADRDKLRWQHETRDDDAKRLAFAAELIGQKLAASIATLEVYFDPSRAREIAIGKARLGMDRLAGERFTALKPIMATEAECASAYFATWYGMPIQWTGIKRHPVPEGWQTYTARSSLAASVKAENRSASHPINAMLNYAYAVKVAHMQIAAIANGYDPTFGIVHNGRRDKPAFILDLIEPERPKIDGAILAFICERSFAAADFVIRQDGVCRLSPQLARVVAGLVSASERRK